MLELLSPRNKLLGEFWSRVRMGQGHECWNWIGAKTGDGFGTLKVHKRRSSAAHRVAWALANKQEPGELLVCHSCNNPLCCNPAHLFRASRAEWMAKQVVTGRARGRFSKPVNKPISGNTPE